LIFPFCAQAVAGAAATSANNKAKDNRFSTASSLL
jgi:hypothetical protein